MANLEGPVIKDVVKLFQEFGKDEKHTTDISLLLHVPNNTGLDDLAPAGTPAFYITDGWLHFLFQFKDESSTVFLPLKRSIKDGAVTWWDKNPYKGGFQMLESGVFSKSTAEKFPGLHGSFLVLRKQPLAKIRGAIQ